MSDRHIVIEGDTYEDALKIGLTKLNLLEDEVEIKILEEKRGSIFRRSYIKLSLIPKIKKADKYLFEETKNLNNEVEIQENLSKMSSFNIDYLADGVYATLSKNSSKKPEDKINDIVNYLEKKSVTEYDINIINKCIKEGITIPFKIAPYQKEILIDGEILVEVSKDKLQAYLIISKAMGGKDVTIDDIKIKLKEENIVYGIDERKIINMLQNGLFDEKILIASGKKPQDGENGRIKHHFQQIEKHKPKILKDGTVDFKDLSLISNVKKGQLLIELIPPTEGVLGTDVFGNEIPNNKGKVVQIIKGKNVVDNEEKTKVYAAVDGQVILKDGKIEVSKVYEVLSDVDTSTGNIKFNGKVLIKGNVKSGFSVEADEDIEVNGVVEGSTLIAKGNIYLNRGIQGNNQAYLECNGDLTAKYIENSTVKVLGNVEADVILHSNVVAGLKVTLNGKRSLVAGGNIKCGEEIRAKTIGSHMGTATNLEVGINPDERTKHEEINNEIDEIEKNLNNLEKTIQLLNKMKDKSNLSKDKTDILMKSLKTKKHLQNKKIILLQEKETLEFKIQNLSKGKVHVSDIMYPGTKITILNTVRHIYDEVSNCTLYRKEGDIVIGPYEK